MDTQKDIQNRMNRLIGQMNSLRDRMVDDSGECAQNIQQLKAIVNGLKKTGSIYISAQIDSCAESEKSFDDIAEELKLVTHNLLSL
jgi:DNA-binding FrmR family transcriptional regulator